MKSLALLIALLAGCEVGSALPPGGGGVPGIDAPGGGGGGGGGGGVLADAPSSDGPANGCLPGTTAAAVGDGHHNAGQDCMNGCHAHGFTFAGTLYNNITGGTAVIGAHIVVTDANNQKIDIFSQQNGNFYTSATVAFPLTVLATSCPNIQHMSSTVA